MSLRAHRPARLAAGRARRAAVAVVLAAGRDGIEALFIKRAERPEDPWSGHIGLPGGRRDPEDTDDLATAVRETCEELGFRLPGAALLGPLDALKPRNPALPPYMIHPFVFGLAKKPRIRPNSEVADWFWVPLDTLRRSETRAPVREAAAEVRAYRVKGHIIWGITRQIVAGLLALSDGSSFTIE